MLDVQRTSAFDSCIVDLKDQRARNRIAGWILRIRAGLLGDHKSVGGGVSEIRIDEGPGYRLYFTRRGATVILLLCGGDKSTQKRDINLAQTLARSS